MSQKEKDSVLKWAKTCASTERLGFLKSFFGCLQEGEMTKANSLLSRARRRRRRATGASVSPGQVKDHSDGEISPTMKNWAPRKENIEFSPNAQSWSKSKNFIRSASEVKIAAHLERNAKCSGKNLKVFIGHVTEVQSSFGMVGDAFFLKSAVKGRYPCIGDRVVVEAEYIVDMPFKWNSVRVMLVDEELKTKYGNADNLETKTATFGNSSDVRVQKKIAPPPPIISGFFSCELPKKRKLFQAEDPESEYCVSAPFVRRPPPPPIISNVRLISDGNGCDSFKSENTTGRSDMYDTTFPSACKKWSTYSRVPSPDRDPYERVPYFPNIQDSRFPPSVSLPKDNPYSKNCSSTSSRNRRGNSTESSASSDFTDPPYIFK